MNVQLTFIRHSSFLLEDTENMFLFDYYAGTLPMLSKEKRLYCLNSHKHEDHYSEAVLEVARTHGNAMVILSNDIQPKTDAGFHVLQVGRAQTYEIAPDLQLQTLRSTDIGVAFLLHYRGVTIFHAGDLNWWYWNGETKQYNNNMTALYQRYMQPLEGLHLDLAFQPLDPRLGEDYYRGMNYLMTHTDTDLVVPMHMWEDYSVIEKMKQHPCSVSYREKILGFSQEGAHALLPIGEAETVLG